MSETSDDHVRAHIPAGGESRVDSEPVCESLATPKHPAAVDGIGEDAAARLREGAHHLAAGCAGFERRLVDGSSAPADSDHYRDLLVAVRDVRCACKHLLEVLGGEVPNGSPIETARRRILVVDDRADAVNMVTAMLEHAGFEVIAATNGLEGLLAAHRTRPTVILMDVQMPVLDGIEATRLLKAAAKTRDIPVIAHTARPESCHVPRGMLFDHVLPKPVLPDVLLALVQRYARD
jgi:two-component system cell cycle response regulator DivK